MPIDLVIPMVFPQDPEWRQEYAKYHCKDATKNVRYRSWGTEELLVRCCMKYMPWVRFIHLILASESQEQEWMKQVKSEKRKVNNLLPPQPELKIVFHREFMPQEYLPCFASPCIEMFLDRIPGLSEQFIYGNDDMFPLSPLGPEDFFQDGLPCQIVAQRPYPPAPNMFQRKCMYQLNMIARPYGKHYTTKWPDTGHIFAAILKTSCREVWKRHGEEIERFLSPLKRTDRSFNHYIYMLYQHFEHKFVEHMPRRQYTDQHTPVEKLVSIIRDPHAGIVCLNDNEAIGDWKRRAEIVREAIAEKLGRTE